MNFKQFHFTFFLGCLAFATQAAPNAPDRLKAACMSADFNHDGFVSLDEFHQDVVNGWHGLPADASGYVVIADLAAIPGMRRGTVDRLKSADADRDGKLSFKEVVMARMAYFEAADTNNDDRLSMQECIDHQRKMMRYPGKAK
jgi:hypothetical protein